MFHQKLSVQTLICCLHLVRSIFATHYVDSLEKLRKLMVRIITPPKHVERNYNYVANASATEWFELEINLINGVGFSQLHNVLDNTMKERTAMGLGSRKSSSVISLAQESLLCDKGLLGTENPQQLLKTVIYIMGLHLALCGGVEHQKLRRPGFNSQIRVELDDRGEETFSLP